MMQRYVIIQGIENGLIPEDARTGLLRRRQDDQSPVSLK